MTMEVPAVLLLTIAACVLLQAGAQAPPLRQGVTIVPDMCLSKEEIANRSVNQDISDALSRIATRIAGGTGTCLDKIYVMAFTSSLRFSDSTHPHNIEVVAAGQTRKILMPDRPGNYESHRGDIWKMSISEDLGFLPGTCLRLCNIQNVTIEEGGTNGWNIDSIVTYGCIDGLGCSPLTQDFDVFRWVDGNARVNPEEIRRFPLTKVSQSSCVF